MSRPFQRKIVASWCLYDFANSTYSAVIAAVVFPVYYTGHIVGNEAGQGDLWWGRAISLSMLAVAVSSPLLGGIADFTGRRKRFLLILTAMCVGAVSAFPFLEPGMMVEGFALMVLANFGMEGAMVFYNSYLSVIAPREYLGRVSSWGFGVGYAGSILSLLIAMPLVKAGWFGATWLSVAGLFAVCSIPAFVYLPPDIPRAGMMEAASRGISYTVATLREVVADREAVKFLVGHFLYADGVATVIVFSSVFAAGTLGFGPVELIALYILVQASALSGAFVLARATDERGPRAVVLGSLVLWCVVCVMGYMVETKAQFWAVAVVAGLGLGTIQAASRAFFAGFIPGGKESEYYGVYALAGKSSSILGPLVFGAVSAALGSQRPAVLSMVAFFSLGLAIIWFVRPPQGGGSFT